MAENTARASLYLPGGGASGTITPDEIADIDKLNDNFRKIDSLLGAQAYPSKTSFPSSGFRGQFAYADDTEAVYFFGANGWEYLGGEIEIVDWNNAVEPGRYWGISAANQPPGGGEWYTGMVTRMPSQGRILQEVRESANTRHAVVWRRYFTGNNWGRWTSSGGEVLWYSNSTSGYVMNASQTITLDSPISNQATGIMLIWATRGGNTQTHATPITMYEVQNLSGHRLIVITGSTVETKYVTSTNTSLTGIAANTTGARNDVVLRAVVGF